MSDIYKYAAQTGLRFSSIRGDLTVEQLFHLPLTSKTGLDLNTLAKAVSKELQGASEESFVEDVSDDPRKAGLTVALDILKDVISTKQEQNRAVAARATRAAERKKLLDILATKKDEKLSSASIEELEKKLAELDG